MLVINLKNYKIGKEVIDLIRKLEVYYPKAIVAVPSVELRDAIRSVNNASMEIIAQHVDYHEAGRGTGHTIPEELVNAGIKTSLLNHSEHRIPMTEIKQTVKRCNEVGIRLIICVENVKEAKDVLKFSPYAIAFEDKKLIATGKSITSYNQDGLKKFADLFKDSTTIPLCGAGISSGEDVAQAIITGCKGVLVASAVAHSQTPEKFLKDTANVL
jgi:triosephosphate isomerase (TIM)